MRNKESTLPGLTVVNDDESKHSCSVRKIHLWECLTAK